MSWLNPEKNNQTKPRCLLCIVLLPHRDDDRNTLFTGLNFKQPPKLSIIDAETLPIGVKARGTSLYSDIISCVISIPATSRHRGKEPGAKGAIHSNHACPGFWRSQAVRDGYRLPSLPGSVGFSQDLIAILFATSCALPTDYPWLQTLHTTME